jgi:hypothetical protein
VSLGGVQAGAVGEQEDTEGEKEDIAGEYTGAEGENEGIAGDQEAPCRFCAWVVVSSRISLTSAVISAADD